MLKALGTKVLTRGAKGTVEDPGMHTKAKSRLNRVLPAGDWAALERQLAYKTSQVV